MNQPPRPGKIFCNNYIIYPPGHPSFKRRGNVFDILSENITIRLTNLPGVIVSFFLLHLSLLPLSSNAQPLDYPRIFGEDWEKALRYEKENRNWMEPLLAKNHISYPLAIAVIFPELVRYSALRDKMEITLLKALYINLGDQYANFSVGQFQMKPSFAERVRAQARSVMNRKSGIRFQEVSDFEDISDYRKSIINDLEDPRTEFTYLIAFIRICDKNFRTNRMDEIERLKFTAAAYNAGLDKSAEEIEKMIDSKYFNTKLFKTENYCYSDVSLYWYTHHGMTRP